MELLALHTDLSLRLPCPVAEMYSVSLLAVVHSIEILDCILHFMSFSPLCVYIIFVLCIYISSIHAPFEGS